MMTWRDLATLMAGYWAGAVSGFALFGIVAVGLILALGFDWSVAP